MNGPAATDRGALWCERLVRYRERLGNTRGLVVEGRLTRMVGLTLEAIGCRAAIGGQCDVINSRTGEIRGLEQDARVAPTGRVGEAVVGDQLLGRVIDGAGRPLDGKGPIDSDERRPLVGGGFNPLARMPIREPLDVGIRAINALLSVGRGQRLGLFCRSGAASDSGCSPARAWARACCSA